MNLYTQFVCVEDRAGYELCFDMKGKVNPRKPFFVEEQEINATPFLFELLEEYSFLSEQSEYCKSLSLFFPKLTDWEIMERMTDARSMKLLMSMRDVEEEDYCDKCKVSIPCFEELAFEGARKRTLKGQRRFARYKAPLDAGDHFYERYSSEGRLAAGPYNRHFICRCTTANCSPA